MSHSDDGIPQDETLQVVRPASVVAGLPMREMPGGGRLHMGGVPAHLRTGSHTGQKGLGRLGNRSGPRDAQQFRAKLQRLADSKQVAMALRTILQDPQHESFMRAVEFVTERAYGRVPQKVEGEHVHRHAVVMLPPMDATTPPLPFTATPPVAIVPAPPSSTPLDPPGVADNER